MPDMSELQAERDRLQVEREIVETRVQVQELERIARQDTVVLEAWGDTVDRREYLYDDPSFGGMRSSAFTSIDDTLDGRFRPVFENEQDLAILRGAARIIGTKYASGVNILEALDNYTIADGFTWEASADDDTDALLAGAVQDVLDAFDDDNDWKANLEREVHNRSRTYGETPLVLWPNGWRTDAQVLESDSITQPADARDLENWLANVGASIGSEVAGDFTSSWSFGVHTRAGRTDKHLGYHAIFDSAGNDWNYFPAADVPLAKRIGSGVMELIKRNVPRAVKRGLTDFYPVLTRIPQADDLEDKIERGGAIQAAIALIERHPTTTTTAQIENLRSAASTSTYQKPIQGGTRTTYRERFDPGKIIRCKTGSEYTYGPMGQSNAPTYIDIVSAALRSTGSRWHIPEYFITSDASNNNFACHDDETEVLTDRGWLRHGELTEADRLGTMNLKNGRLEYQRPTAIHRYAFSGDMVRIQSREFDMLVTPNHRLVVSAPVYHRVGGQLKQTGRTHDWSFERADSVSRCKSIMPTQFAIPHVSRDIPNVDTFILPGVASRPNGFNDGVRADRPIDMDTWLSFLGWWIAEGHSVSDGKRYFYSVGVAQNVGEQADDIQTALDGLPMKWHCHKPRRQYTGSYKQSWNCSDKSLWTWLRQHAGCGSHSKKIPQFVFALNASQKKIVLNALCRGDGRHLRNGTRMYYTASRELANDVQRLAIECGYVSGIQSQMKNGVYPVSVRVPNGRHRWRCIRKEQFSRELYEGTVWCATVPNQTLVTRRNGKIGISGNSILVSGSPFVTARKSDQRGLQSRFHRVMWLVVRIAYEGGYFKRFGLSWEEIEARVTITGTPPMITIANRAEETTIRSLERTAGVLSKKTWIKESGRDVDIEEANLAEECDCQQQQGAEGGEPVPAEQPPADEPFGEFGNLPRRQWQNNVKAIRDELDKVADGSTSPSVAKEMLAMLGVTGERAERFITDAVDNQSLDDPELLESLLVEKCGTGDGGFKSGNKCGKGGGGGERGATAVFKGKKFRVASPKAKLNLDQAKDLLSERGYDIGPPAVDLKTRRTYYAVEKKGEKTMRVTAKDIGQFLATEKSSFLESSAPSTRHSAVAAALESVQTTDEARAVLAELFENCGTGDGGFKSGNKCGKGGGGGSSRRGGKSRVRRSATPTKAPKQKKLSVKAARAKAAYNPSTKQKQDASELLEHKVTKALGGTKSGDNLPMDVVSSNGMVGFEVKMLHDAKDQRINMRKHSRQRKEAWVKEKKGRKAFIVAVDNRDAFEGGKHNGKYSGHKYYYTDKIGAVSLNSMKKANSLSEIRKVLGL